MPQKRVGRMWLGRGIQHQISMRESSEHALQAFSTKRES